MREEKSGRRTSLWAGPPSWWPVASARVGASGRQAVAGRPERFLRAVLTVNAASSAAVGVAALAAAGWWADQLDIADVLWVRLVGAFLVVFAAGVALVVRSGTERLRAGAAAVSAADFAWVVATGAVIAAGAFNGVGIALAVVMAVAVLDFGLLQLLFRSRMRTV